MNCYERVKLASVFTPKPSTGDKLRIGGRTAAEGIGSGYAGGAMTGLLLALLARRAPGLGAKLGLAGVEGAPIRSALMAGSTGLAGAGGAVHGFQAAAQNARERHNPVNQIKELLHL